MVIGLNSAVLPLPKAMCCPVRSVSSRSPLNRRMRCMLWCVKFARNDATIGWNLRCGRRKQIQWVERNDAPLLPNLFHLELDGFLTACRAGIVVLLVDEQNPVERQVA